MNAVADCLSRSPINNISLGIDYTEMDQAQHVSLEFQAYPTAITNLQLANMPLHPSCPVLLCDISTGTPRPNVPTEFRRNVFETLHNLAHPGQKATLKLISQKFVWHGMRKMVNQWTKQYLTSDMGSQFISAMWSTISSQLGIQRHRHCISPTGQWFGRTVP